MFEILVADAVVVEPVSTLEFPANRERNREFQELAVIGAAEPTNCWLIGEVVHCVPHAFAVQLGDHAATSLSVIMTTELA